MSVREIISHQIVGIAEFNNQLKLTYHPASGGDPSHYDIEHGKDLICRLNFYRAPVGPQGLTNEILLAAVIDRLEQFQQGPCACQENARAIQHLGSALKVLQQRSIRRTAAGIEGQVKEEVQSVPASRVVVRDGFLFLGNSKVGINTDSLAGWNGWNRVETQVKRFQPPLTEAELATLQSLATTTAGRNGFREMLAALKG